jgi:hypothetical protein
VFEGGDNDPNTIGFGDVEALAGTGGDISHSDVQDGVNAQGVKANLGDSGGALSFDTGEFDASQTDIDKAAQDAVDSLVKNLDGKDLEKVNIDPYGLISNTPGDQDNNPNGPGDTGLDGKRLDTAKKIADKVQDLLKDKYPEADISIGDGITNGDSADGQKEAPKGSDISSKTQVAGVSFGDLATGDAPADDDFNPEPAKARLMDPATWVFEDISDPLGTSFCPSTLSPLVIPSPMLISASGYLSFNKSCTLSAIFLAVSNLFPSNPVSPGPLGLLSWSPGVLEIRP